MAFGNVSIDHGLWQQPDIVGGFLTSYLAGQQARKNQADADAEEAGKVERDRISEAMKGFDPANPGKGLAALYAVSPMAAMGLQKQLAESRKAEVDLGNAQLTGRKLGAETAKIGSEIGKDEQDALRGDAIALAHQYWSLPPAERTPDRLQSFIDQRMRYWSGANPAIAQRYQQNSGHPEFWNNVQAVARAHGMEDPALKQSREFEQFAAQEGFKNSLPPTQAQQSQISSEQAKRLTDRSDSLRKQFEGLEEVTNYRAMAPMLQGLYAAASQNDKAGDLGLIYGVARMLDPKGAVRESDAGLVGGTGSAFEQLKGRYAGVMGGAKLTPQIRAQLLQLAEGRLGAARQGYDAARSRYTGMGLPSDDPVFGTMEPARSQSQTQPPQQSAGQSGIREGRTATNPQTGQRWVFRGGQWVPL